MTKDNLVFALENSTLRVFIIGEVTHKSAPDLRERIDEKIGDCSPEKVVLDLSRLSFMDSSGLGLIIGRGRVLKERKASLVIDCPNEAIFKLLKSAGIEQIGITLNHEG